MGTKKGQSKYIESPEKMWDLPLSKDVYGNYIVVPPKRGYSGITVVNKRNSPNGYIYFIKLSGQNLYKIGVSNKPDRRLKDIDSYLPFDMEILSIHKLNNVYEIEEYFSKMLIKNKVRREWYSLDSETVKDVMIELHNINIKQDATPNKTI